VRYYYDPARPDPSLYFFWRINVTASYGTTWNQLGCEVEWLNSSNVDLTSPGITVITSGDESSYPNSNLYDNNTSTFHQFAGSTLPAYGGVVFDGLSEPGVQSITMQAHASFADRMPKTFTVQKSRGDGSWTDVATFTNVPAWTGNEKRTFALSVSVTSSAATSQAQTVSAAGSTGITATVATSQAQGSAVSASASSIATVVTAQAQGAAASGAGSTGAQAATSQGQTTAGQLSAISSTETTVTTSQAQGAQAVAGISSAASIATAQAQSSSVTAGTQSDATVQAGQGQSGTAIADTATSAQISTSQAQTASATARAYDVTIAAVQTSQAQAVSGAILVSSGSRGTLSVSLQIHPAVMARINVAATVRGTITVRPR
jgi:hypothetical protein